nr:putative oxidoreductase YbiC [Candidatus Pantoea persica]
MYPKKNEKSTVSQLYRINAARLHQFVQAIWLHAGSKADWARLVANHLVAANLAGHDSHGVSMIPSYMASLQQGHLQLNQRPVLEKDAGAVLTFYAHAGFGQVAVWEAMQ